VVREALGRFNTVWEAMRPGEQKELLRLLVEQVIFDGEVLRVDLLLGPTVEKVIKPRKRGKQDDEPSGGSGRSRTRRNSSDETRRARSCSSFLVCLRLLEAE